MNTDKNLQTKAIDLTRKCLRDIFSEEFKTLMIEEKSFTTKTTNNTPFKNDIVVLSKGYVFIDGIEHEVSSFVDYEPCTDGSEKSFEPILIHIAWRDVRYKRIEKIKIAVQKVDFQNKLLSNIQSKFVGWLEEINKFFYPTLTRYFSINDEKFTDAF